MLPETSHQIHHPHQTSPRKRRKRLRYVLATLLVVFLIVAGAAGVIGYRLASNAYAFKRAVSQAQASIASYDVNGAADALTEAHDSATVIGETLRWMPFLSRLPMLGDTYDTTLTTLDVGLETLTVAQSALDIAQEIVGAVDRARDLASPSFFEDPRPFHEFTDDEKRAALLAFSKAETDMRSMRIALALASQDIARLNATDIPVGEVQDVIVQMQEALPKLVTALDILTPFASVADEFAGLQGDRQFLILFLNNAELRPGGGFIGAYSLAVMHNGDIGDLTTDDSYTADAYVMFNPDYVLPPPYPLQEQLGVEDWYFRDAAWSPSFFETARDARQLLRQQLATGGKPVPEIHDVIGITPSFMEEVLKFVGPISVEGTTYTSDNFYDILQYQVEQGFVQDGITLEDRKDIISTVTNVMIDRLMSMSPSQWVPFFTLFDESLRQKEVAFASFDMDTQAHLEDASWAGVANPAQTDDAIMVVDANLGSLKTDPVVDRHETYSIVPNGNGYRATLKIAYDHNGSFDWKTTRYRTFTRVYVPQGSTLISVDGSMFNDKTKNPQNLPGTVKIEDALGMTSFGTFISIEPGEARTLTFVYDLPQTVVNAITRGDYSLTAFKQMGAGDNLLTLDLDFGTKLEAAEPAEDEDHFADQSYFYETPLSTDKVFRITL